MRKLLLLLALPFSFAYAGTVDLICKGEATLTASSPNTEPLKSNEIFELSFDDVKKTMTFKDSQFCFADITDEKLIIDKNSLYYKCSSKTISAAELGGIHTYETSIKLSRYTGILKLDAIGIATEFKTFKNGTYKCEKAVRKF
jgi:hypothetical protein